MEPMYTGIKVPKVNRAGYKTCLFYADGIEKTIHKEGMADQCRYILKEIGEFDFLNELEGFAEENHLECRELKWDSSWQPVCVGDRFVDLSTMKLYKIIGFNLSSGGSEIYFDVA